MFGNLLKKSSSQKNHISGRKLVARYSRGNVSLQQGKYSTEKEVDKRRAAILKHSFT